MYKSDTELVVRRKVTKHEYKVNMMRAKFCPICGGFSQWTPRLAEASSSREAVGGLSRGGVARWD